MDTLDRQIAVLLADLFLEGLSSLSMRSPNKVIVDYLPPRFADLLFQSLIEYTDHEVLIDIGRTDRKPVALNAIDYEGADVIPLRAEGEPAFEQDAGNNLCTTGFASSLRDHFAHRATRPRQLVTITARGNETQKSAQDSLADESLITLRKLLHKLRDEHGVAADAPAGRAIDVLLDVEDDDVEWMDVFTRCKNYLSAVENQPVTVQGAKLPELGVFLPDPTPEFASGDRLIDALRAKEQSKRSMGDTRLHDNAAVRGYLKDSFDDPLRDNESVIRDFFEDEETVRRIVQGGSRGLSDLPASTFDDAKQRGSKKDPIEFVLGDLEIVGARSHRLIAGANSDLLLVNSNEPFRVIVPLKRAYNPRKERAAVIHCELAGGKLSRTLLDTSKGDMVVEALFEPRETMAVLRIAMLRGPNTLQRPIASLDLVVHPVNSDCFVIENSRDVRLQEQAWVATGRPEFFEFSAADGSADPVAGLETGASMEDTGDDHSFQLWDFVRTGHTLRVTEPQTEVDSDDKNIEEMLQFAVLVRGSGTAVRDSLRSAAMKDGHHMAAILGLTESGDAWRVDLQGNVQRKVQGARNRLHEAAVATLLNDPTIARLEVTSGVEQWRAVALDAHLEPSDLAALQIARTDCFQAIMDQAQQLLPRPRQGTRPHVPLPLLPLAPVRKQIEAWIEAWNTVVDGLVGNGSAKMTPALNALLQVDTLRELDETSMIKRLILLPTHPWVLGALLAFQTRLDVYFKSYKANYSRIENEIRDLVPSQVLEDWFIEGGDAQLWGEDGAPFYPSFVSARLHKRRTTHDYMARIVANKIARYLQMHPHLNSSRRTLRIGFVNPGDGEHLLQGIRLWFKQVQARRADRLRTLPMERIPAVEVFLYHTGQVDEVGLGGAFDRFHQAHTAAADEDIIDQAMVARVRYRKRHAAGPTNARDAVHLCFVYGLLSDVTPQIRAASLSEWWDGGFGEGLLATQLRRTAPGAGAGKLESRRGLWLSAPDGGLRGAMYRLLSLQRGIRLGEVELGKGVFLAWPLPDVSAHRDTYTHSDWVVHLDRELSLEMFRSDTAVSYPTIIEYSDQEVPDTPGFDTITVTREDGPYRDQLHEILSMAGLDTQSANEAAKASADRLLHDINRLSGSWALDFLLGSLADGQYRPRLKGNVGAALAWRWINRFEHGNGTQRVVHTNRGPTLPVFISLEELLRVTPAAGLASRDGLAYRFSNEYEGEDNEKARQYCDDLLVLYITPTKQGQPSRLYGRIIEVKLGSTAFAARKKAVPQVRTTQGILQKHLSGDQTQIDALFRDKQLSLLLKAQIEQAVSLGAIKREDMEPFNLPALSTNLATGNYSVDYTIGVEGRHLIGDAFLLSTRPSDKGFAIVFEEGVRIVRIGANETRRLAFNVEDASTIRGDEPHTLPRLGTYDRAVTELPQPPEVQAAQTKPEPITPVPADEPPPIRSSQAEDGAPDAVQAVEQPAAPSTSSGQNPELPTGVSEASVRLAGPVQSRPVTVPLGEALEIPVKIAPFDDAVVKDIVDRLQRGLEAHGIELEAPLSVREVDRGPRLLRAYVRIAPSQPIASVRRIGEDLARIVGTSAPDLNIINVTERRSVGIDLPILNLGYAIDFEEVASHPTFAAAQESMALGFCAGIDVTGRAIWTDLAKMPHMLVAGTTGSGKTVFLRNVILTLLMQRSPRDLQLRLSSSKPMDFRIFTQVPHMGGTELARTPSDAKQIVDDLVAEMERRMRVIDDAYCDTLTEFNEENPGKQLPRIVTVLDEYAATVTSFDDKAERQAFETAVQRIAQEARAAGIHVILCMQRPDAKVITGNIKANVLHRFALKLPGTTDSRIILDENGAETLLGKGDMLYKNGDNVVSRLQVPNLEKSSLKRILRQVVSGQIRRAELSASDAAEHPSDPPNEPPPGLFKSCPKCGHSGPVTEDFGFRRVKRSRGAEVEFVEVPQSWCRECRSGRD